MRKSTNFVIGIDLSGPGNLADTCLSVFKAHGSGLRFVAAHEGVGDMDILRIVAGLGADVVVGIDAPLSYNPGGGDRQSDRQLRRLVLDSGYRVGIMPPTMIRMVYLTLRGMNLARMLSTLNPAPRLVEVHPGAVFALRSAPKADVAAFKRDESARTRLLDWLGGRGLAAIRAQGGPSDHFVA